MKITYTIGTHNEGEVIKSLFNLLMQSLNFSQDELLIVDDYSTDKLTCNILTAIQGYTSSTRNIKVLKHTLNKDFATHKNFMTDNSSGDFIFNIDADEFPSDYLLANVKTILESNSSVEMVWLPRVNVVDGITDEDIQRYGWQVNDRGWVNFPDHQGRIYKRSPEIRWQHKVHEVLTGYKQFALLPDEEQFALYHLKSIEKQRQQNEFYSTI